MNNGEFVMAIGGVGNDTTLLNDDLLLNSSGNAIEQDWKPLQHMTNGNSYPSDLYMPHVQTAQLYTSTSLAAPGTEDPSSVAPGKIAD